MNMKRFRILIILIAITLLITCQIFEQGVQQDNDSVEVDSSEVTDIDTEDSQKELIVVEPDTQEPDTQEPAIKALDAEVQDKKEVSEVEQGHIILSSTQTETTDKVVENKSLGVTVESSTPIVVEEIDDTDISEKLCKELSNTLTSLEFEDCILQQLENSEYWTADGNPLAYKVYPPLNGKPSKAKILMIGGIHGDEYSAVSIVFKWMNILNVHHSGLFHWLFLPVANPDGLFKKPAQRQNGNGVDLNRNFPSSDWNELAMDYWEKRTYRDPRRYPGEYPSSEIETQWILDNIEKFDPDIVISVHAPFHLLDYDGPENPPQRIGDLYLSQLGVYPGSLGNYGGIDLKKPVVTIELPSAGILPKEGEISRMWTDLVRWLINKSR